MALARNDSATALARFVNLPELPGIFVNKGIGEWDRYQTIKLLSMSGRYHEAASRLVQVVRDRFALDILFMNERPRVAEGLGDRNAAIAAYQGVVRAWMHADPQLQNIVNEARDALAPR